jgi:hypothetical protein
MFLAGAARALRPLVDELYNTRKIPGPRGLPGTPGTSGAGTPEQVALITDADVSVDTQFPTNKGNVTFIYQGTTTGTRTVTLPLAPFVGERVTVAVDGTQGAGSYAVDWNGNGANVSMAGTAPISPQTALRSGVGLGHFSSATVIWTGASWVQVDSVLVAAVPIP